MTSEITLPLSILFILFSTLLGVIWRMLHEKIKNDKETLTAMVKTVETTVLETVRRIESSFGARTAEQHGTLSQNFSRGSARMDDMQKEIASFRVKLAEDYHTAAETRLLVQDTVGPIMKQLDRMEYILLDKRRGEEK